MAHPDVSTHADAAPGEGRWKGMGCVIWKAQLRSEASKHEEGRARNKRRCSQAATPIVSRPQGPSGPRRLAGWAAQRLWGRGCGREDARSAQDALHGQCPALVPAARKPAVQGASVAHARPVRAAALRMRPLRMPPCACGPAHAPGARGRPAHAACLLGQVGA